jgi:hypothetical protein
MAAFADDAPAPVGLDAPDCASATGGIARLRHNAAISNRPDRLKRLGRFERITQHRIQNALIVSSVGLPADHARRSIEKPRW